MELNFWWLLPVGLLVVAAVAVQVLRRSQPRPGSLVPVAHADRLSALPAYQRALQRYRRWLGVAVASSLVLALATLTAAARPAQQSSSRPEQLNRDVMLCLDVSGSMTSTDAHVVEVFRELAKGFHGERVGLTIFDSSPVQVFPLTDDYDFVDTQLKAAKDALDGQTGSYSFFDGTYNGKGSSLIGDGLAGCVTGFPKLGEEKRSRSIVLATDNRLAGKPLFAFTEASELAKNNGVRVYGINPNDDGDPGTKGSPALDMKSGVESTGGAYYKLETDGAVSSIVSKVQSTEAAKLNGAPQLTVVDTPALPLLVALLAGFALVLALWRMRA